ncbi:hypothetical protein VTN96DRAFT_9905 [Rasamsonia emersonii]|uniref:Oxidase ustYa n=1 Tax=Rasamsonia emersonii (strain ATCC 16479 / CBS 393.64 / IMI 116815) TaxID=1408163 RepID=A0A0F4YP27_RASE3|nr:hypothetical protein T310_6630 [Rasamsonia emersonii CBS 393.64]KKA19383.1 hypothetical protein T310_6630 [Rasamsonia emersonii CBS 393.64]
MERHESEKWHEHPYDDAQSSSESTEFLAKLELRKPRTPLRKYLDLRLLFEAGLIIIIIAMLISGAMNRRTPDFKNVTYGPTLPRKKVVFGNTAGFGPEITYHDTEMMRNATRMKEIHRNWQQLFPTGRGYVRVSENEDFEVLHPPFQMKDVLEEGDHYEGYIMSVYHQLHCLSILMTALGTSREEWAVLEDQKVEHRAHCVEYLRQSILCSADTTLEGETGAWARSTGWGQTHSCVDFDALTEWANKRAIWDLSDKLLPISFDPLRPPEEKEDENNDHTV